MPLHCAPLHCSHDPSVVGGFRVFGETIYFRVTVGFFPFPGFLSFSFSFSFPFSPRYDTLHTIAMAATMVQLLLAGPDVNPHAVCFLAFLALGGT